MAAWAGGKRPPGKGVIVRAMAVPGPPGGGAAGEWQPPLPERGQFYLSPGAQHLISLRLSCSRRQGEGYCTRGPWGSSHPDSPSANLEGTQGPGVAFRCPRPLTSCTSPALSTSPIPFVLPGHSLCLSLVPSSSPSLLHALSFPLTPLSSLSLPPSLHQLPSPHPSLLTSIYSLISQHREALLCAGIVCAGR